MKVQAFLTLAALIAGASELVAAGGAPASIDQLVRQADAVVVGRILEGNVVGGSASMTLEIERTFKGPLEARAVAQVIWSTNDSLELARVARKIPTYRGIFFLRRGPSLGSWMLTPAANGHVVDVDGAIFVLPPNSTPTPIAASVGLSERDKVLLELTGALEAGGSGREGAVVYWPGEYGSTPSPALKAAFDRIATSPNPAARRLAIMLKIRAGEPGILDRVVADRASLLETAGATGLTEQIRYYYQGVDPAGIRVLGGLATGKDERRDTREAAAIALARIHTRPALPYLAQLLDASGEPMIIAAAVGGMSMFANNVPIGGHEPASGAWPFRDDETIAHSAMDPDIIGQRPAYYLEFWKRWWQSHAPELAQ